MANENKTPNFGNAVAPELVCKDGDIAVRDGIRLGFTRCFTCNNMCGLRYRVDEATNTITRVSGNPYCEVVTGGKPLPLAYPVKGAYKMLMGEAGLKHRATSCGKGAAGIACATDPRRVTSVLKRAGKRGENKWKTISYEQALHEIVEGGDLFGEGHVDGLRAIRKLDEAVVPGYPEFGSKANQLFATFNEEDTLRGSFYSRFVRSFGSVNLTTKHAYCGAGIGVGYSLGLAPEVSAGMCDCDWDNFEFALFIGTCPGGSGASINRTGRAISDARVNRNAKYVAVDPVLRPEVAQNTSARWVPIKPGTDTAFLYGLVRVILDEKRYDADFLSLPSEAAAKAAGEVNWSNATHLVDVNTQTMLDAEVVGVGKAGENVVYQDGKLVSAEAATQGELFKRGVVKTPKGEMIQVATSLQLLRDEAHKFSLQAYSERCAIPVDTIQQVAREFCAHGRRVVAMSNTGTYANDGAMAAWLICILNSLVASHDAKGGAIYGMGAFMGFEGRYDLDTIEGAPDLDGVMNVCRNGAYESSTEYKNKVESGRNPYPANHLYHPMFPEYTAANTAEMLVAQVNGDPYKGKALFNWRSNALYSASSMDHRVEELLADPKELPLFVGIDAYINETNKYADYIIPDRVMFEEYGCDRTWGNYDVCVVAGVPVLEPRTVKNAEGKHVCMETFLLDVADRMKLPGFGKGAIPVKDSAAVDLATFDDWHTRYMANIAAQCENLPEVTDEDRQFAGLDRAMKMVAPHVTEDEAKQIESLLSRGGYYDHAERYDGEFMVGGGGKFLQFFNPALPQIRHCYSGKPFPGLPLLEDPRFFDGSFWKDHWKPEDYPLSFTSFKPALRSNYAGAYPRVVENSPANHIIIHPLTAGKYSVRTGDLVRIVSANGEPVEGVIQADEGVALNTISVAHCYGHSAYGSEDREIDGKVFPGIKSRGLGTAVNQMLPHDPTRMGVASLLNDYWIAGMCRTGIPVRIEKV